MKKKSFALTLAFVGAATISTAAVRAVAQCVPAPSGLVGWWPGDGNANDIVDGNDGTLLNGASFAAGEVGQAFSLDGVDDVVIVGGESSLSFGGTKSFTIDAWVNPRPGGDGGFVVSKFNRFVIGEYILAVSGGGTVIFHREVAPYGLGSVDQIPFGTYTHIAATYDGSVMRIYVNGVLNISQTRGASNTDTTTPVMIGGGHVSGSPSHRLFDGDIDEVEIFNRALSASEIQAIFNAGSDGKCKGIDTDEDGLLDSEEVDIAMGSGCPDPNNWDSDGDTLSDGYEVLTLGTNPCNNDTDSDGLTDDVDPTPTVPGATTGFLEDFSRETADAIQALDLGSFNGPNNNANKGRRNALANRATEAANLIAAGDIQGAIEKLDSLLEKIDGQSPPPDWMDDSPEKSAMQVEVTLLIVLLMLQ